MRTLILSLLLAAEPIPPTEYEAISRAMIVAQGAQLQLLKYREQRDINSLQLRTYEQQEAEALATWSKKLTELQKTYKAEGCNLNADKKWVCDK